MNETGHFTGYILPLAIDGIVLFQNPYVEVLTRNVMLFENRALGSN